MRRRESVCRSLFGPVDHDQLRQDLQLKLKEIMEQDSQRWNFNFQSYTPKPGRFLWEEIPADWAASFYQESPQPTLCINSPKTEDDGRVDPNDEHLGTNQENCLSVSNRLKCPAEMKPDCRKRSLSKPAVTSTNTRITDYFTKRKRTTEAKRIICSFQTNSSKEAQCQTIR